MSEDTLQWLALLGMFAWLTMISLWIGETTTLLKDWWGDWLKPMIKDRGKPAGDESGGKVKPTRPWPDPPNRNGND